MELKDVQEFISQNKESEDVKSFVAGLNPINLDRIKEFVGKDKDAQSWLDSEKDTHFKKANKTWQDNNLQKLIDEAVAKANPKETPEQKQIRELTARIEKAEKDKTHETLRSNALKIATTKKLPSDLIDFFIGDSEQSTTENLEKLEKVFSAQVEAVVQERLKGGYQPPKDDKGGKTFTMEDLKKMTPEEINTHWAEIQNSLGKK